MKWLVALLFCFFGFFATAEAASSECLYTSIYNSGEKTWLLFNSIEKLATLNFNNESEFLRQWQMAQSQVRVSCGEAWGADPQNVVFNRGRISFSLGSSPYALRTQAQGALRSLELVKTSGNLANKTLMSVVFHNGEKQFAHIVGRVGAEQSVDRYDFVFAGTQGRLIHQSHQDFLSVTNIKSLKAIYGAEPVFVQPRVHVGIIGSGLDYNQPDLAKLLAHRSEIEAEIQRVEILREKLQTHSYWSAEQLVKDKHTYLDLMQTVGFPHWMDQALGGIRPFDLVITSPDGLNLGDHETRITSRIISRRDQDVQIHFVRRMFGGFDTLNVETVVENFYKASVRIVNMSFGSSCGQLPLEEAQWRRVFEKYKDMIFVVAVGNDAVNVDQHPHCPSHFSRQYKNVISVTALDASGRLATNYSGATVNFGMSVDVAIRGDDLLVLAPNSAGSWIMNEKGGTSVAAAEVSRILVEAMLDGFVVDAQTVKSRLVESSKMSGLLFGYVGASGGIDENRFRQSLSRRASSF
jgi:hypothetical protein